jgi:nitrate reductase cytochrome c-type subunit
MTRKPGVLLLASLLAAGSSSLLAQTLDSALRGKTPLNDEGAAAPMTPMRNTAEREVRNYPEQPPVIPHSIDGYQIDLQSNNMPVLPCPRAHRGVAGADGLDHPFHGSRRPVSRLDLAAAFLLHRVPRAAERDQSAGEQ